MGNIEVLDIIPYPNDPQKIVAAIYSNHAKTTDGGNSWTITNFSFNSLALNHQDTSIIFAGSNPGYYLNFMDPFYCYKSENGGISWSSHKLFTRGGGVPDWSYKMWTGDILISPNDPDKILVGVGGGGGVGEGLYKSSDGGDSWKSKLSTGISTIAKDPEDSYVVYLGTTSLGYVYRSEDGGDTWTLISPGGADSFVGSVWDFPLLKMDLIIAGTNPLATDMVAANIMGFETQEIPTFTWAVKAGMKPKSLDDIEIRGEKSVNVRRNFEKPQLVVRKDINKSWGVQEI